MLFRFVLDFTVAGLLPISWAKLFYIAHELNFNLFSGYFLNLKFVGYEGEFDFRDSSSPVRTWRAPRLTTLLSA